MKDKYADLATIEQFFSLYPEFGEADRGRITSAWNDLGASSG